ncbi:UAA transporter [Rhizodiscina lignyota]|uniref:UAA transporter n=1 Tax=Rhizodiscina lignyota TaxID=1504668 RepID=A0A9P4IE17_9PEZI|nr:UAA transporter [Rhizodiscina lignyota]
MSGIESLGIVSLIFGGCCSNVYALEAILKREPDSGLLITLMQFIFSALSAYPSQFDASRPMFIKKPSVPMHRWVMGAAMFFAVNMLNNWAFAFNISVPVHIILRSFGSVTTMGAGWLVGKKYSQLQIVSVVILTLGVIVSAWADALSKGKSMDASEIDIHDKSFEMGLVVLLIAQLLSSYMGIYVQDTYAMYGKHWAENLFYEHLLSLPLFIPLVPTLRAQFDRLAQSPPLLVPSAISSALPPSLTRMLKSMPQSVFYLFMNSFTQLICISGVNLLGAKSSAVTVTVVLNIRKLVSFAFSIWLFGNHLTGLMVVGATLVFGAGALYGWETSVGLKRRARKGNQNGAAKEAKKGQ